MSHDRTSYIRELTAIALESRACLIAAGISATTGELTSSMTPSR